MKRLKYLLVLIFTAFMFAAVVPGSNAQAATKLNAPVISVKTKDYYPKITWKKIKGATSYTVYRQNPGNSKYVKVGNTKKLSLIDYNFDNTYIGSVRYYVIANGKDSAGKKIKSAKSNVAKWNQVKLNSKEDRIEAIMYDFGNSKADSLIFRTSKKIDHSKLWSLVYEAGRRYGKYYDDFTTLVSSGVNEKGNAEYVCRIKVNKDSYKRIVEAYTPDDVYNAALGLLYTMDFDNYYIYTGDVSLYQYAELALLQHPEFGSGISFSTFDETVGICFFSGGYFDVSYEELQQRYYLADAKADEIVAEVIHEGMTELEMVRALHDYVVIHNEYDYDSLQYAQADDTCYSAYGCLIENNSVCMGYTAAMNILLSKCGISSIAIVDHKSEHTWNYVRADGNYSYFDVTWDDPDRGQSSYVSYKYFNVGADTIAMDHLAWDKDLYSSKYVDFDVQ